MKLNKCKEKDLRKRRPKARLAPCETDCHLTWPKMAPKMATRWGQDGAKMGQDWVKMGQYGAKMAPRWAKMGPR